IERGLWPWNTVWPVKHTAKRQRAHRSCAIALAFQRANAAAADRYGNFKRTRSQYTACCCLRGSQKLNRCGSFIAPRKTLAQKASFGPKVLFAWAWGHCFNSADPLTLVTSAWKMPHDEHTQNLDCR